MKWNKFVIYAFIAFVLSMIIISMTRHFHYTPPSEQKDTIVITKKDTIWDTVEFVKHKPIPKVVDVVRFDTIYVGSDTEVVLPIENKVYEDTIVSENDTAALKIHISGYKPSLDSINLKLKKSNVTTTNTKIVTKKNGGFRVNVGVGVGYGLIGRKPDIYVGVGVGYVF